MSEFKCEIFDTIAEANGFKVNKKTAEKIYNAKMRFFGEEGFMRCPCDAKNDKKFCGSETCVGDTFMNGHCCCNLFLYEKEDKKDEEC